MAGNLDQLGEVRLGEPAKTILRLYNPVWLDFVIENIDAMSRSPMVIAWQRQNTRLFQDKPVNAAWPQLYMCKPCKLSFIAAFFA